jgi:hypothetical protein
MGRVLRPGPSSIRGLEWLARVGPSPLDPCRYAMGWSATAARSHARRLQESRWLERRPMVRGEGSLFFATRRGVDFLRSPVAPASTPAPTWWAHNCGCAWVAAWYTLRGRSFLGPRELLNSRAWLGAVEWMDRDSFKQSGHRPDLVGSGPMGTVAFEVELAPKSKPRLDAILCLHQDWLLAGRSHRVGYVCGDEQGVRRIKAAARRATPMMIESSALQVVLLDTIKAYATELFETARATAVAHPETAARSWALTEYPPYPAPRDARRVGNQPRHHR